MKKKWLVWSLVMALVLSLTAGCGASGGSTSGKDAESSIAADSKSASEVTESSTAGESGKEESESSMPEADVSPEASAPDMPDNSGEETGDNSSGGTGEDSGEGSAAGASEILAPEDDVMWNALQGLLDLAVGQYPQGTALEIAGAIKDGKGCFLKYGAFDGEYYLPGINWDAELPDFAEKAYLIDQITFSGPVLYVLTMPEGLDPNEATEKILAGLDPYWVFDEGESRPAAVTAVNGDKLAVFLYGPSFDIEKTYEGPMAGAPRDLVQIFMDYREENPTATALETVQYLFDHQLFTQAYTQTVEPGSLAGIGSYEAPVETSGFADGAILSPMMSPSNFIAYVFILQDGMPVSDFEAFLHEHANVAWNVCTTVNTVIVEAKDNAVLFIMCNE